MPVLLVCKRCGPLLTVVAHGLPRVSVQQGGVAAPEPPLCQWQTAAGRPRAAAPLPLLPGVLPLLPPACATASVSDPLPPPAVQHQKGCSYAIALVCCLYTVLACLQKPANKLKDAKGISLVAQLQQQCPDMLRSSIHACRVERLLASPALHRLSTWSLCVQRKMHVWSRRRIRANTRNCDPTTGSAIDFVVLPRSCRCCPAAFYALQRDAPVSGSSSSSAV